MKFIGAFLFFKGFSAKQQKSQRKNKSLQRYIAKRIKRQLYGKYYNMFASKNDRQDESLTGQVHDQAGHCPLTGRYFEP